MKILIAETDNRPGGFTWTEAGEMVAFGTQCCNADTCGCGRSFSGFQSRKATTLARVMESDISRDDFLAAYVASETEAGFAEFLTEAEMHADALQVLRIAGAFPAGALIERRGDRIKTVEG